jgi:alpha-1,4-digalacturonate transport system permease protein
MLDFLTRTRGRGRLDWTDWASYGYLALGLFLMFGPVLWLVLSSFKTEGALAEFPPSLLPTGPRMVAVAGEDKPKPLYRVTLPDGTVREMAELNRIGLMANMADPAKPEEIVRVPVDKREPIREFGLATENYTDLGGKFDFGTYLWNSVFITVIATLIRCSSIRWRLRAFEISLLGQQGGVPADPVTLMVPPTIVLVPNFLVVSELGLLNSLWGVIWPAWQPLPACSCCGNTC